MKVAAAAADTHSRRTELDNPAAVTMNTCRCRRVEPAALPVFTLSIAAAKKRRCSRTAAKHITPYGVGFRPCERASMLRAAWCALSSICARVFGLFVTGTCQTNARAIVGVKISVLDT